MSSIKQALLLQQNGEEVLRKGPWMPEEDEILVEYVQQFGARDWSSIRCKGVDVNSSEEERLVVEMQAKLGNKWAEIASCLPVIQTMM
ncbi:unnamed protein product [Sphagnum jensenii]|uniref:Uncharacterized protein n=1 Tax=Sphagnum jensenii TaxID=128206 RepID=A0ABP1A5K2_9BRYO